MGATASLRAWCAACCLVCCCAAVAAAAGAAPPQPAARAAAAAEDNAAKVAVDLFVMSKCPDATYTEGYLADVFAQLQKAITLQIHFIGRKQDDGSWQCKHGATECAGDVQQLCVQAVTKPYNRVPWLYSFVLCNNKRGLDATGSFATASSCLKEAGIPVAAATKMLGCMYGPAHQALLEADFAATASLGVTTSATVQFDGETVAVRDGGRWASAPGEASVQDFKEALCAAYAAKNRGRLPPQCSQQRWAGTAASRR